MKILKAIFLLSVLILFLAQNVSASMIAFPNYYFCTQAGGGLKPEVEEQVRIMTDKAVSSQDFTEISAWTSQYDKLDGKCCEIVNNEESCKAYIRKEKMNKAEETIFLIIYAIAFILSVIYLITGKKIIKDEKKYKKIKIIALVIFGIGMIFIILLLLARFLLLRL